MQLMHFVFGMIVYDVCVVIDDGGGGGGGTRYKVSPTLFLDMPTFADPTVSFL